MDGQRPQKEGEQVCPTGGARGDHRGRKAPRGAPSWALRGWPCRSGHLSSNFRSFIPCLWPLPTTAWIWALMSCLWVRSPTVLSQQPALSVWSPWCRL